MGMTYKAKSWFEKLLDLDTQSYHLRKQLNILKQLIAHGFKVLVLQGQVQVFLLAFDSSIMLEQTQ